MLNNLKNRLKETQNYYHSQIGELQSLEKEIKIKENEIKSYSEEQNKLLIEKKLIENACSEAREQGRQFLE